MPSIRKINNRYQAQVRRKGYAESRTFPTKEEAEAWAWKIESQFAPRSAPGAALETLGDVVRRYVAVELPRHRSGHVEAFLLRSLEAHPIARVRCSELEPWHLAQFRDDRLQCVKANSVKRVFNLIRPMLDQARVEWGAAIRGNPAREVAVRSPDDARKGRLTSDQLQALMASLRRRRNPAVVLAAALALETAMRRSELLALRWEDVDMLHKVISIRISKNGEGRVIPMTQAAYDLLNAEERRSGVVVNCSASAIRSAMARSAKEVGLEDWCFHRLRHESISRLWDYGLNEVEISSVSGHKDWKMLRRYSHAQASEIGEKLRAVADSTPTRT